MNGSRAARILMAAALWPAACDAGGTVNDDGVGVPATLRVSTASDGRQANADSRFPSVSDDGRYVGFISFATNLDPADRDTRQDVYVKDLRTGRLTLASRADGPAGAKSDGVSFFALSGNGRYVAFSTFDALDPADTDANVDVYVRDCVESRTWLVSRATGPAGPKGNGHSNSPLISPDGRFVVFGSASTNLAAGGDAIWHVYLRDRWMETTTLLDRNASGTLANGDTYAVGFTDDGRQVAFVSWATNLHPDDGDAFRDLYVRDLQSGSVVLASRASGAAGAKCSEILAGGLSKDGRRAIFSTFDPLQPEDGDATSHDYYLRDLDTHETTLVTRTPSGLHPVNPVVLDGPGILSRDGSRVLLVTSKPLAADDLNAKEDVYLADLGRGTLERVSLRTFGQEGDDKSSSAVVSADGRFVAFESLAGNFADADFNGAYDIFVRGPLR